MGKYTDLLEEYSGKPMGNDPSYKIGYELGKKAVKKGLNPVPDSDPQVKSYMKKHSDENLVPFVLGWANGWTDNAPKGTWSIDDD